MASSERCVCTERPPRSACRLCRDSALGIEFYHRERRGRSRDVADMELPEPIRSSTNVDEWDNNPGGISMRRHFDKRLPIAGVTCVNGLAPFVRKGTCSRPDLRDGIMRITECSVWAATKHTGTDGPALFGELQAWSPRRQLLGFAGSSA